MERCTATPSGSDGYNQRIDLRRRAKKLIRIALERESLPRIAIKDNALRHSKPLRLRVSFRESFPSVQVECKLDTDAVSPEEDIGAHGDS